MSELPSASVRPWWLPSFADVALHPAPACPLSPPPPPTSAAAVSAPWPHHSRSTLQKTLRPATSSCRPPRDPVSVKRRTAALPCPGGGSQGGGAGQGMPASCFCADADAPGGRPASCLTALEGPTCHAMPGSACPLAPSPPSASRPLLLLTQMDKYRRVVGGGGAGTPPEGPAAPPAVAPSPRACLPASKKPVAAAAQPPLLARSCGAGSSAAPRTPGVELPLPEPSSSGCPHWWLDAEVASEAAGAAAAPPPAAAAGAVLPLHCGGRWP